MAAMSVLLKDVTLMWACFDEKNTLSNKYQVDIVNLSDENVEKVKSLGLQVKDRADKPEKGRHVIPRSMYPIVPVFTNGTPVKDKVGNGTTADVLMTYYVPKRRPPGAPDRSPSILKVTIKDLITFVPSAASGSDDL